jgi:hypothetical protein
MSYVAKVIEGLHQMMGLEADASADDELKRKIDDRLRDLHHTIGLHKHHLRIEADKVAYELETKRLQAAWRRGVRAEKIESLKFKGDYGSNLSEAQRDEQERALVEFGVTGEALRSLRYCQRVEVHKVGTLIWAYGRYVYQCYPGATQEPHYHRYLLRDGRIEGEIKANQDYWSDSWLAITGGEFPGETAIEFDRWAKTQLINELDNS